MIILRGCIILFNTGLIISCGNIYTIYKKFYKMPRRPVENQTRRIEIYLDRHALIQKLQLIFSISILTMCNSIQIETFLVCPLGWLLQGLLALTIIFDKFQITLIAMPDTNGKIIELLYCMQFSGKFACFWSFI